MTPYSYIWEYHVLPERVAEFEQQYGPEGSWVALFRQVPGYRRTTLLRDRQLPLRYLTVDEWDSLEAYRSFRSLHAREYEQIDLLCASFTRRETSLGEFDSV